MSKKRTIGQGLTPQDWKKYRPYDAFTPYDAYYLKLANELFHYFNKPENGFRHVFERDLLKEIALLVTCHFEDFISEIGLWPALVRRHEALYGKALPFYDLDDYDKDYLNPQDFAYLIWHHLNQSSEKILHPFASFLMKAADFCYNFFEPRIEEALATDFYDHLLVIEPDIYFFNVKKLLAWMAFDNYLLGPESNDLFFQFFCELSPDLAHYIAERYPLDNLRYPLGSNGNLARDHFDFFLRFFNPGAFREVVPNISLIAEEG